MVWHVFFLPLFFLKCFTHLPHISSLYIALLAAHHFGPGLRDMSHKTTWHFLLALPWPPRARESLNSGPLFFLQALAHIERGKQRKGWRGTECGSGSGGRNVSALFVSVCGAWWMRWVDVMTWLIAQTLNKGPILQQASPSGTPLCHCCQPTWADIVAGRVGGSAAPLSS